MSRNPEQLLQEAMHRIVQLESQVSALKSSDDLQTKLIASLQSNLDLLKSQMQSNSVLGEVVKHLQQQQQGSASQQQPQQQQQQQQQQLQQQQQQQQPPQQQQQSGWNSNAVTQPQQSGWSQPQQPSGGSSGGWGSTANNSSSAYGGGRNTSSGLSYAEQFRTQGRDEILRSTSGYADQRRDYHNRPGSIPDNVNALLRRGVFPTNDAEVRTMFEEYASICDNVDADKLKLEEARMDDDHVATVSYDGQVLAEARYHREDVARRVAMKTVCLWALVAKKLQTLPEERVRLVFGRMPERFYADMVKSLKGFSQSEIDEAVGTTSSSSGYHGGSSRNNDAWATSTSTSTATNAEESNKSDEWGSSNTAGGWDVKPQATEPQQQQDEEEENEADSDPTISWADASSPKNESAAEQQLDEATE